MPANRPSTRSLATIVRAIALLGILATALLLTSLHQATVVRDNWPGPVPMPTPLTAAQRERSGMPVATPVAMPGAPRTARRPARRAAPPLAIVVVVALLGGTPACYTRRRRTSRPRRRGSAIACAATLILATTQAGCAVGPLGTAPAQSPAAYLSGVLAWYQAHSVVAGAANWPQLRRRAAALAQGARTAADTYPAIRSLIEHLGDHFAWLNTAATARCATYEGWQAISTGGATVVAEVKPGGAAARAGVRVGDIVLSSNGAVPRRLFLTPFADLHRDTACPTADRLVLQRPGHATPLAVTLTHFAPWDGGDGLPAGRMLGGSPGVGYLDLFADWGSGTASRTYPTQSQRIIRRLDRAGACGWIIDLRHLPGGDLWTYLAALGPLLGGSNLGGFVYADGHREPWTYRGGKVFWGTQERSAEDHLEGPAYSLRHATPPVALLIGPGTIAAGELAAIALRGRPAEARLFGEPTAGVPLLQLSTTLSDGAQITAGGAYGYDRSGRVYHGPLLPDVPVAMDWSTFETDRDPALGAAAAWVRGEPGCAR